MVDYSVMWLHQRVGRNTAISFPIPVVFLGLVAAIVVVNVVHTGVFQRVGFLLAVAPVVWAVYAYRTLRVHQSRHYELQADCKHCMARAAELQEIEARDAIRQARSAELVRLNRKYHS